MSEPDPNGGVIRYTTKELLAEIRDGISAIKHVTEGHELRIKALELRNEENERYRREQAERTNTTWTRWHTIGAIAIGLFVMSFDFYLAVRPH